MPYCAYCGENKNHNRHNRAHRFYLPSLIIFCHFKFTPSNLLKIDKGHFFYNFCNFNQTKKEMTKKVLEPQVEYQRTKRQVLHAHRVEDKIKISSLRGKLAKQPDEELQHQIDKLREEWERDIQMALSL